ncbi:hypothetical protein B0J13DRAFT_47933 [Dactylonectria estremocensis]|uniref:Uncharacterized protein n=1 Tax=Dactylonectria estremocensis TaxID=1079267 RepID=A0A9P9EU47_9HYPO|nr:hypothetical protein B0J13DRAFT_47933 [Dactylonectria estremocensis]
MLYGIVFYDSVVFPGFFLLCFASFRSRSARCCASPVQNPGAVRASTFIQRGNAILSGIPVHSNQQTQMPIGTNCDRQFSAPALSTFLLQGTFGGICCKTCRGEITTRGLPRLVPTHTLGLHHYQVQQQTLGTN